ncbi:hypothetical protein [Streptomyces nigrescens]|uniref:hypothetical protein n=1 Tax=Streptomyces nigrescens TaxID=1920 RepID=UPI00347536C0
MHQLRLLARRPRRTALLAAGLATAALGALATLGSVYDGQNAGATFGTPGCFIGVEWRGDPGVFGSCTGTEPDAEAVTAYNDGFIDGRADAMGDDNRDGRIDEDEQGWDCHTMGNRLRGSRIAPDRCAQGRDLDEKPGTPEFTAAPRALDAEWREHH